MYRKRYRCRHGISPLRWPENGNPYRWSSFPPAPGGAGNAEDSSSLNRYGLL